MNEVTIIEEPYTCVKCHRQNLLISEISYQENSEGQIIEGTILCRACFLKAPDFKKLLKEGPETEKVINKLIRQFEYNYDRRMVRRVLPKKKGKE
jgi:hypothetical protein